MISYKPTALAIACCNNKFDPFSALTYLWPAMSVLAIRYRRLPEFPFAVLGPLVELLRMSQRFVS